MGIIELYHPLRHGSFINNYQLCCILCVLSTDRYKQGASEAIVMACVKIFLPWKSKARTLRKEKGADDFLSIQLDALTEVMTLRVLRQVNCWSVYSSTPFSCSSSRNLCDAAVTILNKKFMSISHTQQCSKLLVN